MLTVTFISGEVESFKNPVSVHSIIKNLNLKFSSIPLGAIINREMTVDLSYIIENDVILQIVNANDTIGLGILRHSCAHLLAHAVKKIFPEVQLATGPATKDGFYYDFSYKRSFTTEDLPIIEKSMRNIVEENLKIERVNMERSLAVKSFEDNKERYKSEIIKNIPEKENITYYRQGSFTDLCRGPHVPNTGYLKNFKLTNVAGAYWKSDATNEMLTRIYGTCWPTKKELKLYLLRLEQIKKLDHRKIGKNLDFFHFQKMSPGMVFWHPKGLTIYQIIKDYLRNSNKKYNCEEIKTPEIAEISLWEKSGHIEKYGENVFKVHSDNINYVLRPMTCPNCIQVYNNMLRSYRDLPISFTEFGTVYRQEPSGALHGLLRLRSFTQDDGHIFCTEEQMESEISSMIQQCFNVYKDFGFSDIKTKLALRPKERVGDDSTWDKSEKVLADILNKLEIDFSYLPGEGAFYGPKIEFHLQDAIGRSWQCGTIQVDFSMPRLLSTSFINKNSEKQVPVMLHRAIIGSLERFIGVLIEHYAGKLPLWLSPLQIVIIGVTDKQHRYAQQIHNFLSKIKIRSHLDLRNKNIGYKIREHTLSKIPFVIVVGEKEETSNKISVRELGDKKLELLILEDFGKSLVKKIRSKI